MITFVSYDWLNWIGLKFFFLNRNKNSNSTPNISKHNVYILRGQKTVTFNAYGKDQFPYWHWLENTTILSSLVIPRKLTIYCTKLKAIPTTAQQQHTFSFLYKWISIHTISKRHPLHNTFIYLSIYIYNSHTTKLKWLDNFIQFSLPFVSIELEWI